MTDRDLQRREADEALARHYGRHVNRARAEAIPARVTDQKPPFVLVSVDDPIIDFKLIRREQP